MAGSEHREIRSILADVIADPTRGRQSLPRLVGALDHENRSVRIGAACAVCLIANEDPEIVDYIVRRLVDRLDDETSRPETILAFEYLTTQFPKIVDETLQEVREASGREPLRYTRRDGFVRSDYFQPGSGGRDGVGRLRPAGEGTAPGPGLVYGHDEAPQPESRSAASEDETGEQEEADSDVETGDDETVRQRMNRLYDRIGSIVERSEFDQLMLLSGRTSGRYSVYHPVLATRGGREEALSLRLFHEPAEDRQEFRSSLGVVLDRWGSLDGHEHVVDLYDSGRRPQPWAATQATELTLANEGITWETAAAIEAVEGLADGLAMVHQHGIVHGGIDPESIALDIGGEGAKGQVARLDNVGLLTVYRWYAHPSTHLDPRFAAPEYFDPSFGGVDQASDIYGLGAVLYHLLTGEFPYGGSYQEIRTRVRGDEQPSPPSTVVADCPSEIDHVVLKAMSRRKLTRYETAVAFRKDLHGVREENL
jgi:hypothetical protein